MQLFNESNIFFLQKHSHKGKTEIVPCTMSLLGPEHIEQSVNLHDRVVKGLGDEIFIPTELEEMRHYHLSDDGFAIGIWHGDKLICVRTVKTDGDWVNKGLKEMEMSEDPTHTTALTGYAAVDKEFRGNNTQLISYYFSEMLVSKDKRRIVSSVAPKNIFSLQNILRCGSHIIALKTLYSGVLRYITEKQMRETTPIWTNWHHTVSIRNTEEQRRLIDAGNVGYKLIRKRVTGFVMLYAPMSAEQPEELTRDHRHKPVIRSL